MKNFLIQNKKVVLISYYILIILGIINFTVFNTTNSKYIKDVDYALIYENKLNKLYQGKINGVFSKTNSSKETLALRYNFNRDELGLGNLDEYYLEVSNGCSITGAQIIDNTITFSNTNKEKSEIDFLVTCPIDSIEVNNSLVVNLKVLEKINDEDKFLYLTSDYAILKHDFLNNFPTITKEQLEIEESNLPNLYDMLVNWVNTYYILPYDEFNVPNSPLVEIKEYLLPYKNVQKETVNTIKLNGLNVSFDNVNHKYIITLTNNFIGYARTKYYQENADNSYEMYFSTTENLKEIFTWYLNTYFYQDEKNVQSIIDDYFKAKNLDIASFILNQDKNSQNLNIDGLAWTGDINAVIEKRINIKNLLNYARNYQKSPIILEVTNMISMLSEYRTKLKEVYSEKISQTMLDNLNKTTNYFAKAMLRNGKTTTPVEAKSFNNYYIDYDETNKNYILLNAFSNLDNLYNYGSIEVLKISRETNELNNLVIDEITIINGDEETYESDVPLTDEEKSRQMQITISVNIDDVSLKQEAKEKIKQVIKMLNDDDEKTTNDLINITDKIYDSNTDTYGIDKQTFKEEENKITLSFKVNKVL